MKRLVFAVLLILLALAVVVVVRAARPRSRQIHASRPSSAAVDLNAAASHLARALTFRTVSNSDASLVDDAAFAGFEQYLDETYPRVRTALVKERVARHSLLYQWRGSDARLRPLLLLAHQDVVPVESGTESQWTQPPFDGRIAGGFIWGRGALDDKVAVVALLESVEVLLAQGYVPRRTVYLAFGDDEEVGGRHGAAAIAGLLVSRGVEAEALLDEGGEIDEGVIDGLTAPPAFIAVAEKGQVNVELTVDARGGHSSTPPPQTAVGILGAAVARLEANQMTASFAGPARESLEYLGPEMPLSRRLVMTNLWLFAPLVQRIFLADAGSAAMIRTTTAPTIIQGGVKENVLPARARAVVNFRIRPGDTIEGVLAHVRDTVADQRVRLRAMKELAMGEPPPSSPIDSPAFRVLQTTIAQVFPDAVVAPTIVPGGTDAHHYRAITPNLLRFVPIRQGPSDFARWHGKNERLGVKAFGTAVYFYAQYIRNSTGV